MSNPQIPFAPEIVTGSIAYRAGDGSLVGSETFERISHGAGHVLRASCVLHDARLIRDVTLSMNADWTPREGYCRLMPHGQKDMALWFRVDGARVRVDAALGGVPLPSQDLKCAAPPAYLGLHPLQGDALIVEQRGTDAPGKFRLVETVTNSISPNGDEAPGGHLMEIAVAFEGFEDIAVGAGRFAARRYALRWREDWPPAQLWVRREDNLFLLMRWPMIETWYELVEWRSPVAL